MQLFVLHHIYYNAGHAYIRWCSPQTSKTCHMQHDFKLKMVFAATSTCLQNLKVGTNIHFSVSYLTICNHFVNVMTVSYKCAQKCTWETNKCSIKGTHFFESQSKVNTSRLEINDRCPKNERMRDIWISKFYYWPKTTTTDNWLQIKQRKQIMNKKGTDNLLQIFQNICCSVLQV